MITPENMTQITLPTDDLLNYEIILPFGTYTSGSYTIPNGRTWSDFYLLVLIGGRHPQTMGCTFYPGELFRDSGWDHNLSPDGDGVSHVFVQYVNSTTFSMFRGGNGAAHMLIGYLK
jgi:hypothetical protein